MQESVLGQTKAKSFIWLLSMAGRCPHAWVVFCFPRYVSRVLDRKWSSENTDWSPHRILVLQAVVLLCYNVSP